MTQRQLMLSLAEVEYLLQTAKYANAMGPHGTQFIPDHPHERTPLEPREINDLCLRLHSYVAHCRTARAGKIDGDEVNPYA